jgi:PAS domain S-box-containing protein
MEINKSAGKILSGSASGEEVFTLLFRRHPIPMWIYDVETLNFLDLNDAAVEKYGYNREEFLKMTIKDIRPAENVAGLLNDVAKVQSELQHSGEWRHKLKDGRTIDVEITSQTLEYGGHKAALLVAEDITERKQSEQLVRDSEKRFRSIFDQSPVAIALLDIQGHLIISNLPLSKMLGYSTDELSKMKFADFTYPEDVDKDLNLFKELIEGKISKYSMEKRYVHKNGNLIWANLSVTMPRDENGIPQDIIGMAEDITERKKGEEKSRLLAAIVESSQDAIIGKTLDGIITSWNFGAEAIYGYTASEMVGRSISLLIPPGNDEEMQKILDEIRSGNYVENYEALRRKKNGQDIQISLNVSPIRDSKGNVVAASTIGRDISNLKKMETNLLAAAELAKLGYWEYDVDSGNFTFSDQYFRLIHGSSTAKQGGNIMSAEEFAKKLVYPADSFLVAEALQKAIKSPDPNFSITQEARVYRDNGDLANVTVMIKLLKDQSGRTYKIYGANQDITERKRAEETKRDLEAQLHQAQKLESVGTLASGIAHDFNNILGIILGHSSLLERLREDSNMHSESVAAIMKATQRGASLVKQLMLFARKAEPLLESVKINNIIGELTKLMQETFPKTIAISTSLQQDLPTIVADAGQIHQVLLNLFVNARDAMPSSGTLSISTRTIDGKAVSSRFSRATARQYVQIEVTDTGIGMDEATRQRIFEPFFTTKAPGRGTGLGLSVVFGIVEHHNGFIDVRSIPGKGTSFTVYLPIAERAPEIGQRVRKSIEEIPGGTETILVIEDEEMLRSLAKGILVSKGYKVLIAEDGMQGVEMYQSHQKEIAVVLSDVGLPLLSGPDVFRKIREINPEAKVILASGFFDPETKSEMFKAGLKNFIQKPYMHDEVLQKIREVIDAK